MKTLKTLSLILALALLSSFASAQTALTSTTLSAAVTSTTSTSVKVASVSGMSANHTAIFVDSEYMFVIAIDSANTTLSVVRGYNGIATTHANSATVYYGNPATGSFISYDPAGTCTASNNPILPVVNVSNGRLWDCFGSAWQFKSTAPQYVFTIAPGAQRSSSSPSAGNAISIVSQAGGAQSGTTSSGGAGGAYAAAGGIGGIGGSASGTAGAGGAYSAIGGAGGAGPITGGAGGAASLGAGVGGAGSSAGGSGGLLNLFSGAAGSGGTGTAGSISLRQGGAAGVAALSVSTAGATTLASTVTGQAINITPFGSASTVFGGVSPQLDLGVTGSIVGGIKFENATSGSITMQPVTGALGSITLSLPATTGTVSLTRTTPCASANASCTETTTTGMKIISGISGALNGASPSVAAVTFSTGFTSSSTYTCTASPNGASAAIAAGGIAITYTSSTVVTFTSANALSNPVSFICIGS